MLVFEPKQLSAFAEAAFINRMTEILSALGAGTDLAEAMVPATEIAEQLQRARQYGFTEERDCARWVLCAWCLGRDFDSKIISIADLLRRQDVGVAFKSLAIEVTLRAVFTALAGQSMVVL